MIIDNNVNKIVMVTNWLEGTKNKCEKYLHVDEGGIPIEGKINFKNYDQSVCDSIKEEIITINNESVTKLEYEKEKNNI